MSFSQHTDPRAFRQLMTFMPGSYLDRTSRPIYALVYLLGFIILYEAGTLLIHPDALRQSLEQTSMSPNACIPQTRVVAFIWVQELLGFLGFSGNMVWIATPLVVVVILLALQMTSKTSWKVSLIDLLFMTFECIILSGPLIVLSLLLNRTPPPPSVQAAIIPLASTVEGISSNVWVDIVTGIGAGIYEELIFRLILICLLMAILQDLLGVKKIQAAVISILISSLLFSLHHHLFYISGQWGTGEVFLLRKFVFRILAGIYFAVLFTIRGFGVTAGTHAFYDILAALLNSFFFTAG